MSQTKQVQDNWMYINRRLFQPWLSKNMKSIGKKDKSLYFYQSFVRDFLADNTPYRGLLLYHGLGVGKTMSAVAISKANLDRHVVVMLPASIEQNFINEIYKSGDVKFRKFQNHWTFVKANQERKTLKKSLIDKLGLEISDVQKIVKKYGGLWDFDQGTANFETLSTEDRNGISFQLKLMLESQYTFLHYNGISLKDVNNLSLSTNFFDHKLVIIDEVHNFISRFLGGSKASKALYNAMMTATDLKIVCLSGTPLINRPIEIAHLINLIRGYLTEKVYSFNKNAAIDFKQLETDLKENSQIDYFHIHPDMQRIIIGYCPWGFERDNNNEKTMHKSQDDDYEVIEPDFKKYGIVLSKKSPPKLSQEPLLPVEEKNFNAKFIDYADAKVVNSQLLSRRIQGLVSYFESYNSDDYPSQDKMIIEKLHMSDEQLVAYVAVRAKELDDEMRQKKKRGDKTDDREDNENKLNNGGNVYKSFSRAICNFVFPDTVKRPYPSNLAMFKKEIDALDDQENDDDNENDKTQGSEKGKLYERLLNAALKKLDANVLDTDLHKYSPKMAKMYDNIEKTNGTALVYSNFRTVEGLHLFSKVLEFKGNYGELKVKKDKEGNWSLDMPANKSHYYIKFGGKKDETQILLDIFNNNFSQVPATVLSALKAMFGAKERLPLTNLHGEIIKVIMITQSGSEGISLKNVRQVHIMEPYWNEIRIKQVIGRAIRAKSHIDLPKEERNVKVFMYMSCFDLKKVADSNIINLDRKKTVDEIIYDIAQRKSRISNALMDILKSSAVDCLNNNHVHPDVKCFQVMKSKSSDNGIVQLHKIEDEVLDKDLDKVMKRVDKKIVYVHLKGDYQGRPIVYGKEKVKGELKVYFEDETRTNENPVAIGKVILDEETGKIKGVTFKKKREPKVE